MAQWTQTQSRKATKTQRKQGGSQRLGPKSSADPSQAFRRAQLAPETLRATDVQTLQRAFGNRATGLLLQAKLKVGPAGDRYEQEADRTARQVVKSLAGPAPSAVQRKNLREKQDEDALAPENRNASSNGDWSRNLSSLPANAFFSPKVQRTEESDQLAQAMPSHGLEGGEVEANVANTIQRNLGKGRELDPQTRTSMEGAFGANFGGVRIHTDSQSDVLNRSLNSRAFTTGSDVFFRAGEYNPGVRAGKELLAHELTHVTQQTDATVRREIGKVYTPPTIAAQAPAAPTPAPAPAPSALLQSPGPTEGSPEEEAALKAAFQSETFYYGTTGGESVLKDAIVRLHKKKIAKAKQAAPADKQEDWRIQGDMFYWPGERAANYLKGAGKTPGESAYAGAYTGGGGIADEAASTNMMDNYYGNEQLDVHKKRNPAIGKYLHQAMGYKGDYDQNVSGETAYKNTYGPEAGWDPTGKHFAAKPAPKVMHGAGGRSLAQPGGVKEYNDTRGRHWEGLSGTMEISRHVRDGVKKYGGTIVFEGSTLTWNGTFVAGARQGDTNVEAEYMLPYFALEPGKSEVKFGKGKMVFQWKGKSVAPTREHFRSSWSFGQKSGLAPEDDVARTVGGDSVPINNLYWNFPVGNRGAAHALPKGMKDVIKEKEERAKADENFKKTGNYLTPQEEEDIKQNNPKYWDFLIRTGRVKTP